MGILSTNKKIINLGQGYSAGNGISIDDYVISYTGNEGQLYNAGPNIDIYDDQGQLYISGKDWSADIANASSNAYEQATALIPPEFDPSYISGVVDSKLDSTAFSTVSGDYATTSYVDMSDDLTYSRATAWGNQNLAPLNSVADNSAKWNEIEVYEQNSATYLTAHQDISNKLDTTAFSTVSGNFLTTHQVIPSAKWEDASDVVQSNSAQWSENTGDEEVNNAVYNNSAKWNDISVYQSNSANYLTAHQDLSNYATTGDLNATSGILSGAIDYLSGNAGKTYTGISPIVVNNTTNEISADSQDITFGSGLDFTNGVLTVTAGGGGTTYTGDAQGALDEVYANSGVWLTAHQDISNKLDTTAFSTVSGTFLTAHQPISANEWNSVYETVETNSGSWAGGGTSLTGDAQGAVDEVYSNSAHWNDNYSTVTTNSASWGGTPLPMSAGDGIDIQIENDTLVISATGGAGNPEVESYVQTNSASIDEVVSTYETNSGTYLTAHQPISANEWNSNYDTVITNSGVWGGSALQISAGPGIKLDMVNNTLVASTDETVLFQNGTVATKSATLSEPITNFNKIGVLYADDNYGGRYIEADTSYPYVKWISNYGFDGWRDTFGTVGLRELAWSANGNEIYGVVGWQKSVPFASAGSWNAGYSGVYGGIIKVVGINRINSI